MLAGLTGLLRECMMWQCMCVSSLWCLSVSKLGCKALFLLEFVACILIVLLLVCGCWLALLAPGEQGLRRDRACYEKFAPPPPPPSGCCVGSDGISGERGATVACVSRVLVGEWLTQHVGRLVAQMLAGSATPCVHVGLSQLGGACVGVLSCGAAVQSEHGLKLTAGVSAADWCMRKASEQGLMSGCICLVACLLTSLTRCMTGHAWSRGVLAVSDFQWWGVFCACACTRTSHTRGLVGAARSFWMFAT